MSFTAPAHRGLLIRSPRPAGLGTISYGHIACLAPLLAQRMGGALPGQLLRSVLRHTRPEAFAQMAAKRGLPGYDAAFLGFRRGRMGNQRLSKNWPRYSTGTISFMIWRSPARTALPAARPSHGRRAPASRRATGRGDRAKRGQLPENPGKYPAVDQRGQKSSSSGALPV